MMAQRQRMVIFMTIIFSLILLTSYQMRDSISAVSTPIVDKISNKIQDSVEEKDPPPPNPKPKPKPTSPLKSWPIVDNFPLAAAAHSSTDLPPIPKWIRPPTPHVPERTPLFIGFTRNWRLLQQVVVSYINSGWPCEDIYVIENTGVMESNKLGLLSLQNPFFLNHTRLELLGVNVIITPTLFTFAQLQNFYLWTSLQNKWPIYFWSHMDVVAVPFEEEYSKGHPEITEQSPTTTPDYSDFKSIYTHCLNALREATAAIDEKTGKPLRWAMRFFSYDRLALVNVASFQEVGGWDTLIPFYMTDCDMHARISMAGLDIQDKPAGIVFDVASSLDDLIVLYRKVGTVEPSFIDPNVIEEELEKGEKDLRKDLNRTHSSPPLVVPSSWQDDTIWSNLSKQLIGTIDHMQGSKWENKHGRNTWQARQTGGQGDPYYRDSEGFEIGIQLTIEHGRNVFREKWGHRDCDIVEVGLRPEDAWRVEHDW